VIDRLTVEIVTKLTDLATITVQTKDNREKPIPTTTSGEGNQNMPNQGTHGSTNSKPGGTTA